MHERVYQTAIHDVNDLKQRLLEVWDGLDQRIIDDAVAQWLQRLQACVQAEGGYFEHLLSLNNQTILLRVSSQKVLNTVFMLEVLII